MSSGMWASYRYWRRELANRVKRIRSLARIGECAEAKRLYKETWRKSGTSLIGWNTWGRLSSYVSKHCPRKRTRKKG